MVAKRINYVFWYRICANPNQIMNLNKQAVSDDAIQ